MITCSFENGKKTHLRHVVCDAIVIKGNQVLLGKRAQSLTEGGKWGIVGGYLEKDEKLLEAVQREVLEETGWKVKNIQFLKVIDNPDRPGEDRQNVSFVFFCEATEKIGEHDWEVEELQWFSLDNLPEDMAFDHRESIEYYIKYKKDGWVLPKLFE